MKLDKNKLNKIVDFVKAVKDTPGNEEFIAKLREVLDIQAPISVLSESSPKIESIEKIEKYLGLDYSLDGITPKIDYSFVAEADIRNQLEADYREMLRYRYGLRTHKIDFMEFCRYVQLQAEMLLNYYYDHNFNNDKDVIDHLSSIITWLNITKVTYSVQLIGFCIDHNIDYGLLDSVREIRNLQSHRSSIIIDINTIIVKAEEFAKKNKVWFDRETKTLNIATKKEIKDLFRQEIGVDMKAYNQYAIAHTQPYNNIIDSLSKLVSCISQLI